jgi:hypothetical protein
MDKDFVLAEIRRTAEQNGGVPLASRRRRPLHGIEAGRVKIG